jgi:hypothetical protein
MLNPALTGTAIRPLAASSTAFSDSADHQDRPVPGRAFRFAYVVRAIRRVKL